MTLPIYISKSQDAVDLVSVAGFELCSLIRSAVLAGNEEIVLFQKCKRVAQGGSYIRDEMLSRPFFNDLFI